MAGPRNSGTINFDTYDTTGNFTPPAPPTAVKQINGGDPKVGPRKGKSGQINPDSYSE